LLKRRGETASGSFGQISKEAVVGGNKLSVISYIRTEGNGLTHEEMECQGVISEESLNGREKA